MVAVIDIWRCKHPQMPAATNSVLQEQFRTIIMMLSLITGFNDDDFRCKESLLKSYEEKLHGTKHKNEPFYRDALNAITSILVRDSEVVAAVACYPSNPSGTSTPHVLLTVQNDCMDDGDPHHVP